MVNITKLKKLIIGKNAPEWMVHIGTDISTDQSIFFTSNKISMYELNQKNLLFKV